LEDLVIGLVDALRAAEDVHGPHNQDEEEGDGEGGEVGAADDLESVGDGLVERGTIASERVEEGDVVGGVEVLVVVAGVVVAIGVVAVGVVAQAVHVRHLS
jgi:hypothetical protein